MKLRFLFVLALGAAAAAIAAPASRPNILWIVSEDNSPYLGCYGDPLAQTPNLDKLAAQGIRYRNAISNAPVCSVTRTTLLAGMHSATIGTSNHRSDVPIPGNFQRYPT
ncbi:MAG TPA: sulfatase-like hydrolase/transferase, partial [Opitutaceae bacterium]